MNVAKVQNHNCYISKPATENKDQNVRREYGSKNKIHRNFSRHLPQTKPSSSLAAFALIFPPVKLFEEWIELLCNVARTPMNKAGKKNKEAIETTLNKNSYL